MRKLIDALNESLVQINEEFGAEVLRTTFIDNPKNKPFFKNELAREFKWDAINDNDIERVTCDIAAKAAYKKSEDSAYILWLDRDDNIIARTIGITVITPNTYAGYFNKDCPNVRKVAAKAAEALMVTDWRNFDTNELKKQRVEARKGALAFKTEKEILQDNLNRYTKMLNDQKYRNYNFADFTEKAKSCVTKMTQALEALSGDFVPESWEYFNNNFQYLSSNFRDVMDEFRRLADENKDYEHLGDLKAKYGDDVEKDVKSALIRRINDFNKAYTRFETMYLASLDKEDLHRFW